MILKLIWDKNLNFHFKFDFIIEYKKIIQYITSKILQKKKDNSEEGKFQLKLKKKSIKINFGV